MMNVCQYPTQSTRHPIDLFTLTTAPAVQTQPALMSVVDHWDRTSATLSILSLLINYRLLMRHLNSHREQTLAMTWTSTHLGARPVTVPVRPASTLEMIEGAGMPAKTAASLIPHTRRHPGFRPPTRPPIRIRCLLRIPRRTPESRALAKKHPDRGDE